MNITRFLNNIYFSSRAKEIDLYAGNAGDIQHRVLMRLVSKAARTEWGRKYDFSSIRTYGRLQEPPANTDL